MFKKIPQNSWITPKLYNLLSFPSIIWKIMYFSLAEKKIRTAKFLCTVLISEWNMFLFVCLLNILYVFRLSSTRDTKPEWHRGKCKNLMCDKYLMSFLTILSRRYYIWVKYNYHSMWRTKYNYLIQGSHVYKVPFANNAPDTLQNWQKSHLKGRLHIFSFYSVLSNLSL